MMITILKLQASLSVDYLSLTERAISFWYIEVALWGLESLLEAHREEALQRDHGLILTQLEKQIVVFRSQLPRLQLLHQLFVLFAFLIWICAVCGLPVPIGLRPHQKIVLLVVLDPITGLTAYNIRADDALILSIVHQSAAAGRAL